MRLLHSLFFVTAALAQDVFQDEDHLALLQMRKHTEALEESALSMDASGRVRVMIDRSGSNTKCVTAPVPVTCAADAGDFGKRVNRHNARDTFSVSTDGDQVCVRRTDSGQGWGMRLEIECTEEVAPDTVHVLIDRSNTNTKCVNAREPVICDADAGDLGNRINSHGARDRFEITADGARVCARRLDSGGGWGMHLEVACRKVPPADNVNVLIDSSRTNTKCVTAPVPVICAANAGDLGNRVNNHGARDTFEITTDGDQVCARRTDRNQGWGMHLQIACTEDVSAGAVRVLIDRSGANTKCVNADEPLVCAANAGDFGNRINPHQARDTFEVSTNGNQVCARRTDSRQGWGMRLEVECRKAPAPDTVNVLIDRSGSNTKCVNAPVPVVCAANAGDLGNRVNNHGAGDTFEISTNGDRVCARRTDSRQGWGMRLEISCTEVAPAAKVRVLIDRSGSNQKCVNTDVPVSCAADAGDLGNRINSHGARDTFAVSTNGNQVCARRTDSGGGWGMRLEIECVEVPAPETVNVLIDRSGGNRKCVDAGQPVTCAQDAGNLGNRINNHGARDTFDISTNGAEVCARRTDSGGGWGMHLEIACTAGGAPATTAAPPTTTTTTTPRPRPPPPPPRPRPPPCTKTRRGPWTITSCPGRKTEVSMTIKGLNVNSLDDRKRAILDVFKAKALADMSRFLRLDPSDVEVVIRSGSAIIVGLIDADLMPDDFDAGNGENLLQEAKDTPGMEELVEEGGSLDRCVVDPEPDFPIDDEAEAVGDPHLTFATGGTDDLCCEGGHCVPCSEK